MILIPFWKMSGSGNDFIVIDNRERTVPSRAYARFAKETCRRRRSIGADGLIVVETSRRAAYRWRLFNSDGSQAAMCGNGARCVAMYAFLNGFAPASHKFETLAGIMEAGIVGHIVRIGLRDPRVLARGMSLDLEDGKVELDWIDSGVPHAVLFVDNVETVAVGELGPQIRYHEVFSPHGTNVDFVSVSNSSSLLVRTYERGVEGETLACGTGVAAAACAAGLRLAVEPPVKVATRGGDVLTVSFDRDGDTPTSMWLEGEARHVYEGHYRVVSLSK